MPDGDVKGYCSINIEPQACEADHIGIAALTDALVKPAGFGLEIWYLDRSPGEEINRSFHSEPMDQNYNPIPDAPMLRLLYRPYVAPCDLLSLADADLALVATTTFFTNQKMCLSHLHLLSTPLQLSPPAI